MTARTRHIVLFVFVMMLMVSLACTSGDAAAPQATNTPEIFPVTETPVAQITPTPVPSSACPRPDGWHDYVVGEGEDLATIAAKFNIEPVLLQVNNCLIDPILKPGQVIFVPPPTPAITRTSTAAPTVTPTPIVGNGPGGCVLRGTYIADVTIPDSTVLDTNAPFLKTWRIRNDGTCQWDAGYQLVHAEGAQMGGLAVVSIPPAVPGQVVDISVDLVAPGAPGDYAGTWQLRASNGAIFGGYTVVIRVVATPTDTPTPSVGSIQGEVKDFSGPIGGAKVETQLAGLEATTDPNGRYFFSNMPPGEEFVTVGAPLHLSAFQAVTVRPGQTATADFALIRAIPAPCPPSLWGTVEGRVLIKSHPAVGARVWFWDWPAEAITNEVGWYVIPDACGRLILAESGDMRGGVVVEILPRMTITAPDSILSPR